MDTTGVGQVLPEAVFATIRGNEEQGRRGEVEQRRQGHDHGAWRHPGHESMSWNDWATAWSQGAEVGEDGAQGQQRDPTGVDGAGGGIGDGAAAVGDTRSGGREHGSDGGVGKGEHGEENGDGQQTRRVGSGTGRQRWVVRRLGGDDADQSSARGAAAGGGWDGATLGDQGEGRTDDNGVGGQHIGTVGDRGREAPPQRMARMTQVRYHLCHLLPRPPIKTARQGKMRQADKGRGP